MEHITDISKIKAGDYLSETQYYRVISVTPDTIEVQNERGLRFKIAPHIVGEGIYTAHQYRREEIVTKTEIATIFHNIDNTVFTVNFNKQMREKDARDALLGLYANIGGQLISQQEYEQKVKEIVKSTYQGEERTLVGYKFGVDENLGRSLVIDLEQKYGDKEYDQRIRLVDHRTINWLIYKNVRYVVK
jgi:hypothetical protein